MKNQHRQSSQVGRPRTIACVCKRQDDSVCMQPRTIACAYTRQDDRTSVDRRRVPKGDSRVDTPDPNPNTHFL